MHITIDTAIDDFETVLTTVNAAFGMTWEGDEEVEAQPNGKASNVLAGGWTEKKLRKWAGYLRTDAQHVVRYVAAHAPEVPYDDVAEYLGKLKGTAPVDGRALGGAMSSGGHALNWINGPKSQPFDRDHSRRLYVIDERVAAVLADELGSPQKGRV